MTEAVQVDLEALGGIADVLGSAAHTLGSSGKSSPAGVDAGDATALAAGILQQLTQQAAHLCEALEGSSDGVVASRTSYQESDDRVARLLMPGGAH